MQYRDHKCRIIWDILTDSAGNTLGEYIKDSRRLHGEHYRGDYQNTGLLAQYAQERQG